MKTNVVFANTLTMCDDVYSVVNTSIMGRLFRHWKINNKKEDSKMFNRSPLIPNDERELENKKPCRI